MSNSPEFVYYACPFCGSPIATKWPGLKVEMSHGDPNILSITVDATIHECPSGQSHYQVMTKIAMDEYNNAIKLIMKAADDDTTTR